jgi:hypothetical protein
LIAKIDCQLIDSDRLTRMVGSKRGAPLQGPVKAFYSAELEKGIEDFIDFLAIKVSAIKKLGGQELRVD